ncbi:unnamed protein product [Candidula unifasciata]|uniref:G-protein coupled receptors family 1 profile domain-containing protein n=1 Tax=Candidula unifasciata TaxID=100452 RepID=A0A8S3YQ00_9EUPU|nr:unnamed protein product [Candidula unifasciata]
MDSNNTHDYVEISVYSVITCFVLAVSCVIICESVLVIVIICRTTNLHTNTDIIVASLCANDILLCMAYIVHALMSTVVFRTDQLINKSVTSLVLGIAFGTTFTSFMHMGFVSVDRFIFISHPFYYIKNMTRERNFKVLLALWITGLVYMIIPVFVYTDSKYHQQLILTNPPFEYTCVVYITFIINTFIASTCYFKIARVAFHHNKASNVRRLHSTNGNGEIALSLNRQAAMKSVKFFAVTFGLHLALSSPMLIVSAINFVIEVPNYVFVLKSFVYLVNSLMNCLIYAFMRKAFLKTLRSTIADGLKCCFRRTH